MAIDKKSFKKMFPNLYEEIETGDCKVPIDAVRKNTQELERGQEEEKDFEPIDLPDKFRHFSPSAVDFIRRCDTEAQAKEIIEYLLKKGEITTEHAEQLRNQLKSEGLRSFGPKKEENYYFKEGRLC